MKQSDQVRRKNVKRGKRKRTLSSREGRNLKASLDEVASTKVDPPPAQAPPPPPPPPPPSVQPDEVESNSSGSSSKEDKGQSTDARAETIFSNTLLNNVLNMKKKEFFQSPEVLLFLQSRIKSS